MTNSPSFGRPLTADALDDVGGGVDLMATGADLGSRAMAALNRLNPWASDTPENPRVWEPVGNGVIVIQSDPPRWDRSLKEIAGHAKDALTDTPNEPALSYNVVSSNGAVMAVGADGSYGWLPHSFESANPDRGQDAVNIANNPDLYQQRPGELNDLVAAAAREYAQPAHRDDMEPTIDNPYNFPRLQVDAEPEPAPAEPPSE